MSKKSTKMTRKDFLKRGGLATLVGMVALSPIGKLFGHTKEEPERKLKPEYDDSHQKHLDAIEEYSEYGSEIHLRNEKSNERLVDHVKGPMEEIRINWPDKINEDLKHGLPGVVGRYGDACTPSTTWYSGTPVLHSFTTTSATTICNGDWYPYIIDPVMVSTT